MRLRIKQNGYIDFEIYDKLTSIWKILEEKQREDERAAEGKRPVRRTQSMIESIYLQNREKY